jgi:hypothetical protein
MDTETHTTQPKRRRGRPTVQIVLTEDERQTLERWAQRRTSSQALALRCRIVLACAQGLSNVEAGARLGCIRPRSASGGTGSPSAGWRA